MTDSPTFPNQLFPLGQVAATVGALDYIHTELALALLRRHATGDWGELDDNDRERNDIAVQEGLRIVSAYALSDVTVLCITEADRSATTFLLPSER